MNINYFYAINCHSVRCVLMCIKMACYNYILNFHGSHYIRRSIQNENNKSTNIFHESRLYTLMSEKLKGIVDFIIFVYSLLFNERAIKIGTKDLKFLSDLVDLCVRF